jgi:hypothetical protein
MPIYKLRKHLVDFEYYLKSDSAINIIDAFENMLYKMNTFSV